VAQVTHRGTGIADQALANKIKVIERGWRCTGPTRPNRWRSRLRWAA